MDALTKELLEAVKAAHAVLCCGPYPGRTIEEGLRLRNDARKKIRAALKSAETLVTR